MPLTDADGRHRSIEEVAADALAQVREAQPDGPYSLIGYSFGGLVAFETARRAARGRRGGALPGAARRPPARGGARARGRSPPDAGPPGCAPLLSGRVLATVVRRLRGTPPVAAPPPSAVPDAELGFFLGSEAVSDAYRPGALDGDVTFYLAAGSRRALRQTLSAWRRRARRLAVVDVPGHHGDIDDDRIGMLSDRHVRTLAARVAETLA